MAARTANSLRRIRPRATRRLAQLTQAISSEIVTAAPSHNKTDRAPAPAGCPGRSSRAFATLKTAVFAPIPNPSIATTIAVKPGQRTIMRRA